MDDAEEGEPVAISPHLSAKGLVIPFVSQLAPSGWAQQAMASLSQTVLFAEQVLGDSPLDAARTAIKQAYAFITQVNRLEASWRSVFPEVVLDLDVDDMDKAAAIAQGEGIPVAWVPRLSTIKELISLPDESSRFAHLETTASDVIDDCRDLARGSQHRWIKESMEAAEAFSDGHWSAAQSHAANVIDTIVLELACRSGHSRKQLRKARSDAKERAAKPIDEDAAMTGVAEALAMMPLLPALKEWWPGDPLPSHFSRHATAHAAGEPGVSSRPNALVSVLLATSLARQFG